MTELIGEGGMGSVYRGKQSSVLRDVCVKFIHADLLSCPKWYRRFERETRVLAAISHPGIVSVYSTGLLDNVFPYMVMEFIDGCSLRQFLCERGKLDWHTACHLLVQVCDAMDCAHENGIVHRDLKPDNIIVAVDADGEYIAKVIDFGICGFDGASTVTGGETILGSVLYMAPESFEKAQNQPAVDTYALGCILNECLTGKPLFEGTSLANVCWQHANESAVRLKQIDSASSTQVAALQQVIDTACAKKPSERFSSCREMSERLAQIAGGQVTLETIHGSPNFGKGATSGLIVSFLLVVAMAAMCTVPFFKNKENRSASWLVRAESHLDRLLATFKSTPDNDPEKQVLGKNLLERLTNVCDEAIDAKLVDQPPILIDRILSQVHYLNDTYDKTEVFLAMECHYVNMAVAERNARLKEIEQQEAKRFWQRATQMAAGSHDPKVHLAVAVQRCNTLVQNLQIAEARTVMNEAWRSAKLNDLDRNYRWGELALFAFRCRLQVERRCFRCV